MIGTITNAIAIVLGSSIGLLLKKGIPQPVQQSVNQMLGLSVLLIGLNGVITSMLSVNPDGSLAANGTMLLLCSLVIGVAIGELMRLEDRMNGIGAWVEKKLKVEGFAKGCIDASLIFCVGAMTIIGALEAGISGDSSILFTKSMLDFIASIILSSSMGIGVMFSAVFVLLYQGGITLFAGAISVLISDALMIEICMVGYAIVMCIGINFIGMAKIKTGNVVPALLVPIVYNLLMMLKTLWQ